MPTSNKARAITILGIDPGYADVGYAVVRKEGNKHTCTACGTISTRSGTLAQRLCRIEQAITRIMKIHKPTLVSVERLFFFKNQKTALDVAHARGVIILAVAKLNIPLFEYTQPQVKESITSYGQASKQQVCRMLKMLLNIPSLPKQDDAVDALAIALCAAFRHHTLS